MPNRLSPEQHSCVFLRIAKNAFKPSFGPEITNAEPFGARIALKVIDDRR
jgi:hypothetical protein